MDREHGTRFQGFSAQFLVYSSLFDYMTTCFTVVFSSAIFDSTDSDFLERAELLAIVSSHYGKVITIFFERIQSVLAKQQCELKSRNTKDLSVFHLD